MTSQSPDHQTFIVSVSHALKQMSRTKYSGRELADMLMRYPQAQFPESFMSQVIAKLVASDGTKTGRDPLQNYALGELYHQYLSELRARKKRGHVSAKKGKPLSEQAAAMAVDTYNKKYPLYRVSMSPRTLLNRLSKFTKGI